MEQVADVRLVSVQRNAQRRHVAEVAPRVLQELPHQLGIMLPGGGRVPGQLG